MAKDEKDTSVVDWQLHVSEEVRHISTEGDPTLKVIFWTRPNSTLPLAPHRRIAFWHPGIGEHSRRYKHVAHVLLTRVPALDAVATYDMRCHGGSGGGRGKIGDIEDIECDVRGRVFPALAERFGPDLKVVLMGHSLGGLVTASIASGMDPMERDEIGKVQGVFLSAPAIEPVVSGFNRFLLPVVHVVTAVPFMRMVTRASDIRGEDISHDGKIVALYKGGDTELMNLVSFGLASSILKKGNAVVQAVRENAECCLRSDVPVLIVQGEEDQIVAPVGSKELADAIAHNVELVMVPKAFHEMHNETKECGRDLFFDKLTEFAQKVFE